MRKSNLWFKMVDDEGSGAGASFEDGEFYFDKRRCRKARRVCDMKD